MNCWTLDRQVISKNSNHKHPACPQDQIEKVLTKQVITQAEGKLFAFQNVLTSIVTETIFQIVCYEMTKANNDISVTLRAVQEDSDTLTRVFSEA